MIVNYKYCGIQECSNGSKRIWGAVTWVDNDWTSTYLFWGSAKNPMVKKYVGHNGMPKSKRLPERIRQLRNGYYRPYTEIPEDKVKTLLPDLESHIGMHVLARKLKTR